MIISKFNKEFPFEVNGKKITAELFNSPDIDILLYAFNYEGNTDIDKFNEFNLEILKNMSFDINRPVNSHNYMVVSTTLDYRTYGNAVNQHLKNLGLDITKWTKQKSNIELFRTAVMNVNLYTDELKNYYYDGFISEIKRVISKIIEEDKLY
ncbi:MAG: hypothetical protein MJ231_04900 [bacterium]|nr:hypothetical protein [bacterium]